MSRSIEELRAQRKLIQQHLNWLDAQIQEAEKTENPSVTSVTKDARTQEFVETTTPVSDANARDSIEAEFIQPSSASDIRNVQVGCIVIFTAITLLFLFLLFGLPYLLD